ncbi:MAG: hypothetical protein ACREBD_12595 [Blastocatellia bacterium]
MNRLLALVLVPAILVGAPRADINQRLTNNVKSVELAKELWEKAIEAKGGRKRLYAVNSLAISYDLNKKNRTSSNLYVFPNKCWVWADHRPYKFGLITYMQNHDLKVEYTVYGNDPDNPHELELKPEKKSEIDDAQLYYLLETKWLQPVILKAYEGYIGQKRVDIIDVKVNNQKIAVFLDKRNHLPIRISYFSAYKTDQVLDWYGLSDYREVAGVTMPHSFNINGNGWVPIKVEINPQYNPQVFERPPSIKAGPEQWRGAAKVSK